MFFELENPNVPLVGGVPLYAVLGQAAWALVNLILSIFGLLLAIIVTSEYMRKKRRQNKENMARHGYEDALEPQESINSTSQLEYTKENVKRHEQHVENNEKLEETDDKTLKKRKHLSALTLADIIAIFALILFIITQNMRNPMVLIDMWTIAHVVLIIVEIIALKAVFRRQNDDDISPEEDIDIEANLV